MPDIHDSSAAQTERARQQAADRSRRYRAAKREEGKPDVKAVDMALAEATSYLVSVATTAMTVNVTDLTRVATVILKREGYRKGWSRMAVVERIRPRIDHDSTTSMPSRRLTHSTTVIEPPRKGKWSAEDIDLIRKLSRQRDAVPR